MKYNYQKICANLLKDLPSRTVNVLKRRFGLETGKRETLEAIGKSYDITRERVRQIENEGFFRIKPKIQNYEKVFSFFNNALESFGGLRKEEDFLQFLSGKKDHNQVFFLLTLNNIFNRYPGDKDFYPFWAIKKEPVKLAKKVIKLVLNDFQTTKAPVFLDELFAGQKKELERIFNKKINKDIFYSYLQISKEIRKNPEGRFGLKNWLEINPRGVKDKAYLVLKKEGKPLHFAQVASLIEKLPFHSQKKPHTATVHNELIKDSRFVLVGRGLYALKEWGYAPGMVKDVISKVLKEAKEPLSKDEILKKVLEQRFVKKNTVVLNLQDSQWFVRGENGRYKIREA